MKFTIGNQVEFINHVGRKVLKGKIINGPKGIHRVYVVAVEGPDWYKVPEALMTLQNKV